MKHIPSWKSFLGYSITIGIFLFLGYRAIQGIHQISISEIRFSPFWLLLSFFCQAIGVIIAAGVWSRIMKYLGMDITYIKHLEIFTLSAVGRKIPGTIWYAVGRVFLYDRLEQAKSNVVLGLLIEAIVNSLAGLFALIISIMISPVPLISGLPTWTLTILVIIFLGFSIISPKLITIFISRAKWFSKQIDSENKPKIGYSTMSFWLFGQTLVVLLGAGVAYFLIKSIDQSPTISFALILGSWGFSVALGLIATWFPADIGLKNGIMYVALSPLVGGPLAGVFTLSWRIWVSFLEILFGVISAIRLRGLLEKRRDKGRSHSHD